MVNLVYFFNNFYMTHVEKFDWMSNRAEERYCKDVATALDETSESVESVLNF